MNKQTRDLIIKLVIIICIIGGIGISIYSYFKLEKTKEETYKESIFTYLTTTYKNNNLSSESPLLGLLNYSFDSVNTTLSVETLINSNLMSSSKLNDVGVDNIYNSIYGINRKTYISKSNYLSNGNVNCYYQKNVLKKNLNCDSICSMSKYQIMSKMTELLQWPNVLPSDADTFCIKNPIYPIEGDGYFVNLSDMKTIYKNITNNDLNLNTTITNNKYYRYNSYLVTSKSRLADNILEIISVDSVEVSDELFTAEYTALTEKGKELKGIITLQENNKLYYVVSNKINSGYILN